MANRQWGSRRTATPADDTRPIPQRDEPVTPWEEPVGESHPLSWRDEPVPPWEAQVDITRSLPLTAPPTDPGFAGPPSGDPNRTTFSNQAALIADLLRETFSRRFYGRSPHRVVRIDEPDGPSTAGGLLARQPISLVARWGPAPSIVCGWVDVSKKEAQLRSYELVTKRHEARHGTVMDVAPEEYERFLNELVDTLFSSGIKVLVFVPEDPSAEQLPVQAQPSWRLTLARLRVPLLVTLAFALGLCAGMNLEVLARWAEVAQELAQLLKDLAQLL